MLANAALWAPSLARVFDTSLRYTVDKTTREILFLPLPGQLKRQAKPFVDVTVDRTAKGIGGLLALVLIAPWGLNLDWQRVSYASLVVCGAVGLHRDQGQAGLHQRLPPGPRPRRRRARDAAAADRGRLDDRDAGRRAGRSRRGARALRHRRPRVARQAQPDHAAAALPRVAEGAGAGADGAVGGAARGGRASGARASSGCSATRAPRCARRRSARWPRSAARAQTDLVRPYLDDANPRIAATAAAVLAGSSKDEDRELAERTLTRLSGGASDRSAARREVAIALRQNPRSAHQPAARAAPERRQPARRRPRRCAPCASAARATSCSCRRWCRCCATAASRPRHATSWSATARKSCRRWRTSSAIPRRTSGCGGTCRRRCRASRARRRWTSWCAALVDEKDAFLRYKCVAAIDRLHDEHPELTFDPRPIETLAWLEGMQFYQFLSYHDNLFTRGGITTPCLLKSLLEEKRARARDRVFFMLAPALSAPRRHGGALGAGARRRARQGVGLRVPRQRAVAGRCAAG